MFSETGTTIDSKAKPELSLSAGFLANFEEQETSMIWQAL